jgi:HprK-related kinase B
MNKPVHFERHIQSILAKQNLFQNLSLEFDDCLINVETTSPALKQKLKNYFSPFIVSKNQQPHITVKAIEVSPFLPDMPFIDKPPDPGKKKIKEQYCDLDSGRLVRKKLTGMLFYFNRHDNLALGPCADNDNQVINFINNRFIQWKLDQGCLLCHAAAVANNDQGLILAGFSGMGKSTLALHLMNNDLTFISNDRLIIKKKDHNLVMFGVAKLPRVNPGTILNNPSLTAMFNENEIKKFNKVKKDKIWDLEYKYDVFLDQCFGPGKFRLKSNVKALVILNWHHNEWPMTFSQIDLEKRTDLLETVMKSPGLFYLSDKIQKSLAYISKEYIDFFSLCKVYEVSGGINFDHAAEKCHELIA